MVSDVTTVYTSPIIDASRPFFADELSAEEDQKQHRGLETEIRRPSLPPTRESDGVARGDIPVLGTAQPGVRVDEAFALEEGELSLSCILLLCT